VTYLEGPDRHHATYSVRVKKKDLKKLQEEFTKDVIINDINEDEMFTQFAALVRVNETVSKVTKITRVIILFGILRDDNE